MASSTTEIPVSPASLKTKGSDALEAEAVGLEVSVRVHGSQITAVVLESTEHVEPFEEDTTTMIVFPRGGVVKLRARVRTGHAIVLTNLLTKQTALCRIVQVNSAAGIASYVKLEFIQPVPGFWGVHFPSDPPPTAKAQPAPASGSIAPPLAATPAVPTAPLTPALPRIDAQPLAAKPAVREMPIFTSTKKEPSAPAQPATEYVTTKIGQKGDLVPLANDQSVVEMKIGVPAKPSAALPTPTKVPLQTGSSRATVSASPLSSGSLESSVFDSLSTEEEVFSREPAVTRPSPGDIRTSFDPSSILQPTSAAKPRSRVFAFASIAVVILGLAAGATVYLRHHPLNIGQARIANTNLPAVQPAATRAPAQSATTPPLSASAAAPVVVPPAAKTPSASAPVRSAPLAQSTITITPVHGGTTNADSDTDTGAKVSTGTANIYAGDLVTHPQITRRTAAPIAARPPEVGGAAAIAPGADASNSFVSGNANSNLPAPPPPAPAKPAPVQGGRVVLPKLIHRVDPIYPQVAVTEQVQGNVQIQAQIDASGKVTSAKVINGPVLLRGAAVNAVRQWKYSPATLNGKAISTQYAVTVIFRLHQ